MPLTVVPGRMRLHWPSIGLLLVETCLVCTVSCPAQSESPGDLGQKLSARVPRGRVEGTFVEALGEVAHAFNIPMGISWLKTAASEQKRAIDHADATVLEVIEAIASSEPNYEVSVNRGIVHVATKEVPFGQNFLYLRIPEFSANGFASFAKAALWMQLNQQVSPDPLRGYAGSILSSTSEPKLDLNFTNATVEEILDSIAVASDYKTWLVTFEDSPILTRSGFRQTESRLSKTPTPEEGQPVWDIFRWEFWPVRLVTPNR